MEQMSVFDILQEPLKIDKPVRLIELFAGIGSQAKALQRLGVDFEHYRVCEFDKYAISSYNAIHGTDFATSDVTKITADDLGIVDTDKYYYILTYSFPCQDLSLAGKQKLMAKGSGTRSSLLWEVERLLNECEHLPQVLLMENVTQVHGKKNKEHFDEWIRFLESKGYQNYWQDLNAKNFGIPQNRNRTFMVSVLGEYTYEFPEEFPLELRLKDMLEDCVEEKYYLSGKMVNYLTLATQQNKTNGNGNVYSPADIEGTSKRITTKEGQRVKDNFIEVPKLEVACNLYEQGIKGFNRNTGEVLKPSGICNTIQTMQGGNRQPKIFEPLAYNEQNGYIRKDGTVGTLTTNGSSPKHNNRVIVREATQKGYDEAVEGDSINLEQPNSKTRRGRVGHGVAQTIMTAPQQAVVENCYVSEKGVRFICSPKRGMATDVNADVSQPLTAKGQANWTGSFISPDIENLEKSSTIGSNEPTKINLKDGSSVYFDGVNFSSTEKTENLLDDVKNGTYPPNTAFGKYLFQSSRFDDKPLEECSQTIKSTKVDCGVIHNLCIRKLTPLECWRLMGFDDEDFYKASQVNSNSQLYKQAGNSIVVDVLYFIFLKMF